MDTHQSTARALAALGHEARLTIFRLLVRAGDEGLSITQIATHLDMAASTLAYHLKSLVEAGLVRQEKQGRHIMNQVDYDVMHGAVTFLTAECCAGITLNQDAAA